MWTKSGSLFYFETTDQAFKLLQTKCISAYNLPLTPPIEKAESRTKLCPVWTGQQYLQMIVDKQIPLARLPPCVKDDHPFLPSPERKPDRRAQWCPSGSLDWSLSVWCKYLASCPHSSCRSRACNSLAGTWAACRQTAAWSVRQGIHTFVRMRSFNRIITLSAPCQSYLLISMYFCRHWTQQFLHLLSFTNKLLTKIGFYTS